MGRKRDAGRIARRLRERFVERVLEGTREPNDVARAYAEAYDEVQRRHPRAAAACSAEAVSAMTAANIRFAIKMSLEGLSVQRPAVLEYEHQIRRGAQASVEEIYGSALDELRILRAVAHESCEQFHMRHVDGTFRHEALARLTARGHLVADEIDHLLRGGYPSGALARWRSLHEVSVIAAVIADSDEGTAERYLNHETIGRAKAARAYQEHASALGEDPLADAEVEAILDRQRAATTRYGSAFKEPYGWAAELTPGANFATLETLARRAWLRPYYHLANHPVHAGAHNLLYEIGLDDHQILLTGPSVAGLIDPIQLTAMSLTALVRSMLYAGPDTDQDMEWIVRIEALEQLTETVIAALPQPPETERAPSHSRASADPSEEAEAPSLLSWPDVAWSDVRPRRWPRHRSKG